MDHIPVHIGAVDLKGILYGALIAKWNGWTDSFPLPLNDTILRNQNWVVLAPRNPDRDVIADQFFKPGKKGAVVFKPGKCVINLHVPNEIYRAMLDQQELASENKASDIGTVAADFTVSCNTRQRIL